MPRKNNILIRSGTTAPTAGDFNVGEPAWDKTNKKLYVKAADGTMVDVTGSGGSATYAEYATAASFPSASTSTGLLALDKSTNRLYRSTGSEWAEVGSLSSDSTNWSLLYPGAPTGVTLAGNGSSGQLVASWTAPSFAGVPLTDYVIQYSSNSGSTWTTFSDGTSTSTSATLTGLTDGTSYVARVAAVNSLGQGAYSSASSSAKPNGDPYWSSVSLLLLLDGSNNSTTFTDSGPIGHTITRVNAVISTTQSKFGGASLYLNGSSYLSVPSHASLSMGTGDFTLEFWCYHTDQTAPYPGYFSSQGGWDAGAWGVRYDNSGAASKWGLWKNPSDPLMTTSSTYSNNTWRHIAFVRQSGTYRLYVDGVQGCSSTTQGTDSYDFAYGGTFRIGFGTWDGSNGYATDYLDCIRVTKGVCRYPSGTTFTPSTTAFPNY